MSIESRELVLFAANDENLYRQRIHPVLKNLAIKKAKGTYDPTLALKLWKYVADDAAQRYTKENGGTGNGTYGMFTPADRRDAAKDLQEEYAENLEEFHWRFGSEMPKKYRAKNPRNPVTDNVYERSAASNSKYVLSDYFYVGRDKNSGLYIFEDDAGTLEGFGRFSTPPASWHLKYKNHYYEFVSSIAGENPRRRSYYPQGSNTPSPRYNEEAVNAAIASSNRSGRKIGKRESKAIHALLRGRNPSDAMKAFNVYLNGKLIDTIFYSYKERITAAEVEESLINHDGYDPGITVRLQRTKRTAKNPRPIARGGFILAAYGRKGQRAFYTGSTFDDNELKAKVYTSAPSAVYVTLKPKLKRGWKLVMMRKNPVAPLSSKIRQAESLYRDFSGDAPEWMKKVKVDLPSAALAFGTLDAVEYTTVRDGETQAYRHHFKKAARPTLAVGGKGNPLLILGGNYHFTERGIEDE